MSRGPGRIERSIAALFDAGTAWTTTELCVHAFGLTGEQVEKKHRVSVLSAARRVVARRPGWVVTLHLLSGPPPRIELVFHFVATGDKPKRARRAKRTTHSTDLGLELCGERRCLA